MKSFKIATLVAGLAGAMALASVPASAASIPPMKPSADANVIHVAGRHGGHHGGHHRHWRGGRGFGLSIGVPLYGGTYYRGNGCAWLHRRAVNSGSRYWWRRYRECRGW